jgi:YYY domain-containing protein
MQSSPSARRLVARDLLVLALIVLAAGLLRLNGVNWDQGTHLHPDERFLTMVAADIHRPDSLAAYFDTARSPLNPANVGRPFFVYGTLPLFVARFIAESVGMTSYDQIYLVGRVLSSVFDLGTVVLTFCLALLLAGPRVATAASALAAFCVLSVQQAHFFTVDSAATCLSTLTLLMIATLLSRPGLHFHILFGAAFGLALSCRINLALLGSVYGLALLYLWYSERMRLTAIAAAGAAATLTTLLVFRVFQPYAFAGPGFFDLDLSADFLQSTSRIRDLVTGAADYPPSVQWIGRVPVLSAGANLALRGLGPAWGVMAIVGTGWCLLRRTDDKRVAAGRIVLLWSPLLFFFHSTQFAATLRYFLPIIPTLAIAAAWWLAHPAAGRARSWLLAAALVATALWCGAFSVIYRQPHTRVAASTWIYGNVAAGTTIAVEHWDDALPLSVNGRSASDYTLKELKLYDEEGENKRRELIAVLDTADLVVISSNRLYGSIPRAPWRYPLARRYYELLFSGQLGFQLERVFASYPRIGSFELKDDDAEEAFSVYDHPKVLIFRKTAVYSHDRVTALLAPVSFGNITRVSPRDGSSLYRRYQPSPVRIDGEAGARSSADAATMNSWTALARWLVALEVLSLAFFALLFRPLAISADRGYGLAKILAWTACGWITWVLTSSGLTTQAPGLLRTVAALAMVAGAAVAWRHRVAMSRFVEDSWRVLLAVEAIFLGTFVLFLLLRSLNPAIFWGEKPMDFAILNAAMRAATMPPPDPWFAGLSLNYFYFGHALTAFFAELTGVPASVAFNLAIATLGGLLAVAAFLFSHHLTGRIGGGFLGCAMVVFIGNLAGPRLLLGQPSMSFDFNYFWSTSRVVQGTINEFPFWNLVFADLHAHVLSMPVEVALLYLGALWIAPPSTDARSSPLILAGLIAWLGGTVAVISSWSTPTVMAVQLGVLVTLWIQHGGSARSLFRYLLYGVGMLVVAAVSFLPFWSRYEPPVRQWGWVTGEFAPLADVLTIFGVFLIATLPPLIQAIRRSTWSRTALTIALGAGIAVVTIGLLRSPACAFFLAWGSVAAVAWASAPRAAVRTAALLVAAAAAIGAATEVVVVWDRMNTVFKYYLQMWLLLGCGAAVLVWSAWQTAKHRWAVAVPLTAFATLGLFTSVSGAIGYIRHPHAISPTPTLNGTAYLEGANPSELAAYQWINREIAGIPVVLEAHGDPYQAFSRVSMNTGLPTLLGWQYHLFQQGRSRDEIEARAGHVREIYETEDPVRLETLLEEYGIDFIFVGSLEQHAYGAGIVERFARSSLVEPVFKSGGVTIFARPGRVSTVKTWIERPTPPPPRIDPLSPLKEPRGIAVANDGSILVADFGNRRIQRLGPEATPLGAFGVAGDGPGQFRDPCGIAVGTDGRIWVADTWNHRVQVLSPDGRQLMEWRADLYGPRGIALSGDGNLYLTDTGHQRVLRFTPDGAFEVIADRTLVADPIGIAIDRRGEVYIADAGHRRIVVLSPTGRMLREWPIDGWQPGGRMEPYLAVGPDDVVWVTDPPNHRVLLFEKDGAPVGVATAASPLKLPLGIAIVDRTTALVTDAEANAVVRVTRTNDGERNRRRSP